MMKIIGVISDTHIPRRSKKLPEEVYKAFSDIDMIIHAGDILDEEVIFELEAIAPVHVVAGNNDSWAIYEKYGMRKIIEVCGKKIGITHGAGDNKTYINAMAEFIDEDMDCIVYGHSHAPHNEIINGILVFNPGSPTDKRRQPQYSIGRLYIDQAGIKGEIIYF